MSEDLEPLSSEIARLLEVERARPAPPAEMQARVLGRLGVSVLDVPWLGEPGLLRRLLRGLPLAGSMLVLGGVGGAALHAKWHQPAAAVSAPRLAASPSDALPLPSLAPAASPAAAAAQSAPSTPLGEPVFRAAPAASHPPPLGRDVTLAAERTLIEQARTALVRGRPGEALGALLRHEREFPAGALVEEREGLEILCLAADHQVGPARAKAAKFQKSYPKSVLQRAIDNALGPPE